MLTTFTTLLESDPDQELFARIYRANFRQMNRLAARLLGQGPQAEDAVHDTFLKLIRHFDELRDRPEERLSAWLAVVVKNTALDVLRREKHEVELETVFWEPTIPPDLGEFQALVALIRQMPEEYRRVLELRFVAEWSLQEIAAAMDLTESAVKTRVFRGRKMLIEQLRKEGYTDGRACI
ncbi:sigma-70 family RNA polymerase sigma factor [Oscillibacter sp.]|uniref:RNA polymerase sigma factor n=1 Tax=Oscillibacter sp. TaxID=1945593 RepID=UPI0026098150|nr:sigma-70 family RNA polymerase sigma factor [Oscillibacter sp.]MDD3346240.1 sigma-70 family RNA polymerase sigma factor [Oscillibacter sp.]